LGNHAGRHQRGEYEHTLGGHGGHSKPELSTLAETGTFYFGLTAI